MAMTFAMVSNLREQLSTLIHHRAEEHQKAEMEKERKALEVRTSPHRELWRPLTTLSSLLGGRGAY